jgi:hypothetical protein
MFYLHDFIRLFLQCCEQIVSPLRVELTGGYRLSGRVAG